MSPPVLSIAQVCELLGCSRSRVFELLADGVLDRAPRFGRSLRIYTDSVLAAVARPTPRKARKRKVPGPPPYNPANVRI